MRVLPESLAAWGTRRFAATLQTEIGSLGPAVLQLKALSTTGHALDTGYSLTLMGAQDAGDTLQATIGVFFDEIVPGCSCGFEAEPQPAYGELSVTIDKTTARALIAPVRR